MSRPAVGSPPDDDLLRSLELDVDDSARERPVRWVGKYRILSELGRGGMSNVYLAVARGPGGVNKLVVLKAVLPELASEPGSLAAFLDEARLAAQLNHPNVVQTYEVGTEGDRHVIVMEYLEGQTLAHVLHAASAAGQRLSTAMFLRIVIGVLEGLHYAHELAAYDGSPLNLVHRDVSPQNIFVTYRGQVKVLDFGIAKASTSSTHTATGVVKGKIAYMAPEQMVADQLDRRADVYSVGCVLWAAAAGRKLWKDTPDVHIMRRVINGDIPTPQSVNQGCDDELNRIVMKALATDPERRYPTALALQEDLEHYCERFSEPVKQKEIGAFVSSLFADVRAELKALVERQLSQAGEEGSRSGETSSHSDVRYGSLALMPNTSSSGIDGVSSSSSSSSRAAREGSASVRTQEAGAALGSAPPRRRAAPIVLALLGIAGAGALYFALRPAGQPAIASVPPNRAPAAVPEAKEVAPKTATIQFRVEPPEAELYLNEQKLPSNPTSKVLEIDGKTHQLRAQAQGYAVSVTEFSVVRDSVIELSLNKVNAEKPAPSARPRSVRTWVAPKPSATAPAKPKSCSQPFYVDGDGIKKVRAECM